MCAYLGFSTFLLFSFVCMEGRSSISWREERGGNDVKEQSRVIEEVKRQGTGRVDARCDRETNEEKE